MKRFIIPIYLLLVTTQLVASPMHFKLKHSVIIDTDAEPGDLRTISLLMSLTDVKVKAVLISGNTDKPGERLLRIRKLIGEFGADSVLTGCGPEREVKNRNTPAIKKRKDPSEAVKIYSRILRESEEKITIVCIGSLTNIAQLLRDDPGISEQIEEIIWYNDSASPTSGHNYDLDPEAAEEVLKSVPVMDIISNLNYPDALFRTELKTTGSKPETIAAKIFISTFNNHITINNAAGDNFRISEELVAVGLANHELFEMTPSNIRSGIRFNKKYSVDAVNEVIEDIIKGTYKPGHFVALRGFPVDRELYTYDVRLIMDEALGHYGAEEWKACVLTDEFHGHLGVFSIVGAKMGIYAREHFGIGTDLLQIHTYAGSTTPFSCMNDGLQVSTGATLGQGTIHLVHDSIAKPQALFRYNDKSILVKLKPEYLSELQKVISEGVKNYGLDDEDYWILVRQSAIRFWLEWDRNKIFDLTIL